MTITNSTFDSNTAVNGPGGGIDLDTSSTTSGSVTLTGVTISNNQSSNPSAGGITIPGNGGGLAALAGPYNVSITGSTITGNAAQTNTGGGLYFEHVSTANSIFILSGVTISNNSAFSQGGGRVTTQNGRSLSGAQVTITDQSGVSRRAMTNASGYFRFANVLSGETYVFSVSSKRYRFATRAVYVTEDLNDLIFVAQE